MVGNSESFKNKTIYIVLLAKIDFHIKLGTLNQNLVLVLGYFYSIAELGATRYKKIGKLGISCKLFILEDHEIGNIAKEFEILTEVHHLGRSIGGV